MLGPSTHCYKSQGTTVRPLEKMVSFGFVSFTLDQKPNNPRVP